MKKTVIIIPLTNSIEEDVFKHFEDILEKTPKHVIFCIATNTENIHFDKLKKLESKFQEKMIMLTHLHQKSLTNIIIQAHQFFLNNNDIEYFANYDFKNLVNINSLYNKIDTIVNNPNLSVVFCERHYDMEISILSQKTICLLTCFLNFNTKDYSICTNVINKTVAHHVYNKCDINNRIFFKIYFITKLYTLFGRKKIRLAIY